jgi:methylmalonyl-CoA mutase N-terminal domain/subunit
VALQALAAVLGGTQSLHTNGFDEALALPTAEAATLALRTQQIIAYETGVTATPDPLGGSYYLEYLTDEVERRARALIAEIDAQGGAVAAIESGYMQARIEESAYETQMALERGESLVVGVNIFKDGGGGVPPIHTLDPAAQQRQIASVQAHRAAHDGAAVAAALAAVDRCARGTDNLLVPMRAALATGATIGEICNVLRHVWGEYTAP